MKFALIGVLLTAAMLGGYVVGEQVQLLFGTDGALVLWLWVSGGAYLALRGKRGK